MINKVYPAYLEEPPLHSNAELSENPFSPPSSLPRLETSNCPSTEECRVGVGISSSPQKLPSLRVACKHQKMGSGAAESASHVMIEWGTQASQLQNTERSGSRPSSQGQIS
ncbi:dehydrogenase/reductase SDR family member 1 [Platysternon megacephalum]|uniref:Dehydrogenase/reductase SDR family member 1 n=1 Tax=Platysternon megacephalum TaxID=55544 RepID=A0A4D9EZ40_9SAUR|nr:dehydrogenase/reductase SDR family member 1 [Platysternon megacephalum]